jgi:hypothetical protein
VKASFWEDPDLLQLSRDARTLFHGMFHLADDSGCIEYSPFAYKTFLFRSPVDSDVTTERLAELADELLAAKPEHPLLIPYTAKGKRCLYITNFHEHQTLRSPSPPEVPLPPWITWEEAQEKNRSGRYAVTEPTESVRTPYGDRTDADGDGKNPHGRQPEPEPEPEPKEIVVVDAPPGKVECMALINRECPMWSQKTQRFIELLTYGDKLTWLVLEKAVRDTLGAGVRNIEYVLRICETWEQAGIRSVADAELHEQTWRAERERRTKANGARGGGLKGNLKPPTEKKDGGYYDYIYAKFDKPAKGSDTG